jgi:ubiquinone/menaquinone biosynthesis C-methylase UbiE
MMLLEKYEEKFNGINAVKSDESWQRCMNPVGINCYVRERYDYSVGYLYGNVLDIGAGDGFGAYLMLQNPNVEHVTCFDVQDEALLRARQNLNSEKRVSFVKGIAEQLPFADREFDCVHCGHTLEHVFNDLLVLREIGRVAMKVVVISVPLHGGINRRHVREYNDEQEFLTLLDRYFKTQQIKTKIFPRGNEMKSLVTVLTWKN